MAENAMTTNRMGLEQTLSDERLELFIRQPLDNGLTRGEQMELVREALACRKASKEPVAWTDEVELRGVEKDGCGYLFKANPITPHADPRRVIMLYAAPPLQAVTVPDVWIKCSEKMPEQEEQYYLTYSDGDGVCRSYFFDGYFADQHITHWMPLVLPPSSVTNEP